MFANGYNALPFVRVREMSHYDYRLGGTQNVRICHLVHRRSNHQLNLFSRRRRMDHTELGPK